MEVTVLPDICFSSSLSFIWYLPIPFVAKSFWNVTLRDWEVYWPPRTEGPRWSSSSDTVKFYIGIVYLFLGYSFHLFLCWLSSDTLLSSNWVLDHRPGPFQCKLYLWDQLAPIITLQNLAFQLLGRKGGFWYLRLISLMALHC